MKNSILVLLWLSMNALFLNSASNPLPGAVKSPTVLLVEGNIGVGKTTFLNLLRQRLPQAVIIEEPCGEWQNIGGHNLLEAFYKDNARWACTMQLYVLMTIVRKFQKSVDSEHTLYVMERSLYTSKNCFAKNLALMGKMNELEVALYHDVCNWCNDQMLPKPTAIIYLRAQPEVCYDRMKARARSEEGIVPLDYLQTLHARHDAWLLDKHYEGRAPIEKDTCPVLVLDASCNFRDDEEAKESFLKQILAFLPKEENTKK